MHVFRFCPDKTIEYINNDMVHNYIPFRVNYLGNVAPFRRK